MKFRRSTPWLMATTRAALGPVFIVAQQANWNPALLAGAVVLALLSDIFDGVLARRWHCDTPGVRLFDSIADTIFYFGVAIALWLRHPDLVRHLWWALMSVAVLEVARLPLELLRFGKPASYHSRLAKLWGLTLANAAVLGFVCPNHRVIGVSWLAASLVGILCDLEGLAMSLILPVWRNDVPSVRSAWHLRRALQHDSDQTSTSALHVHPGQRTSASRKACLTLGLLGILFAAGTTAGAEPLRNVTWIGGSLSGVPSGATGQLEIASPDSLTFRSDAGASVVIPYSAIQSYTYQCRARHHLGVLPAIAVGLLAARQHQHLITIGYTEVSTQAKQAAIVDLDRDGAQLLLSILRQRTSISRENGRGTSSEHVE